MSGAVAALIDGGTRLHLQHGPIDLIIAADPEGAPRQACFATAARVFESVLATLVEELAELRRPFQPSHPFAGPVAQRMQRAVAAFPDQFATPMIAVAGSVADHVLTAARNVPDLTRLSVNNGGDVAIHLVAGETMTIAIAQPGHGAIGHITIGARDGIGGIATSGWGGRSHSLGIADAVTVLAADAATADIAATLLANAVDLPGHSAIRREPANMLDPDSDLGERLVTTSVGRLSTDECRTALKPALDLGQGWLRDGRIAGAALFLQGEAVMIGRADALTVKGQTDRHAET